jgi:hypothetical protein
MGKNILIFSDGTGMAGGITFDEDRTNIYKLYRATRCSPDSCIKPEGQVAFYDPGLGSPAHGGFIFGQTGRWIYSTVSQATGLGLTANIIDCYAACRFQPRWQIGSRYRERVQHGLGPMRAAAGCRHGGAQHSVARHAAVGAHNRNVARGRYRSVGSAGTRPGRGQLHHALLARRDPDGAVHG